MDKHTADALIAFANDEPIQRKSKLSPDGWWDMPDGVQMCVPCDDYEYRAKREPREFWIRTDVSWITNSEVHVLDSSYDHGEDGTWIKVREVIE